MAKTDITKRHEKHFSKIFSILDDFRDNYVKAPTFVITLVTIVLIMAGSIGGALGIVFYKTEKNSDSIVEMSIQQGRILERQRHIEKREGSRVIAALDKLSEKIK